MLLSQLLTPPHGAAVPDRQSTLVLRRAQAPFGTWSSDTIMRRLDARVLHVAVVDDQACREVDVDAGKVAEFERAHAEVPALTHHGIERTFAVRFQS